MISSALILKQGPERLNSLENKTDDSTTSLYVFSEKHSMV